MTRQRVAFACCNPNCTHEWFENTVDLEELPTLIVECPFCHSRCYVEGPPPETQARLRGDHTIPVPDPTQIPDRIPTRPVEEAAPQEDKPQ